MLDDSTAQELLRIMSITIEEKKMRVLAAILKAQSKLGYAIRFNQLKSQLQEDESGNTVVDSLIYRMLTQLEKDGFVKVDRSRYRHTYSSGFSNIQIGLENRARKAMKSIDDEIIKIESEMKSLGDIDISDLARSTLKLITGRSHKIKSVSALGKEGFENLLFKKIFSDCSRHDLIRIALNGITDNNEIQSNCIDSLHTHSKINFKIQFLFTQSLDDDQLEYAIYQLMKIKTTECDARFHMSIEPSRLQSFISRNTDGVLLVPTDYPYVSVWIPRILNSKFVNDTISSFDYEFSNGVDILGETS